MDDGSGTIACAGDKRPISSSPVPSITIQVSKKDAEHFMKVSNAITTILLKGSVDVSSTVPHNEKKNPSASPLHEMMFKASNESNDEAISIYRNKLNASPLTQVERKASFVLFHISEFDEKLTALFEAFASPGQTDLPRSGLLSLFRTLLTTITYCCGTENSPAGGGERSPSIEPPRKRVKREDTSDESIPRSSPDPLQVSSFDGSLVTLHDEDQREIPKEIEDVAVYGTEQVLNFAKDKSLEHASVRIFKEWYSEKGKFVAPWLELLSISKWKLVAERHEAVSPSEEKENLGPREEAMEQISFDKDTIFDNPDDPPKTQSFPRPRGEDNSKPLVSFDFSGSGHPKPLCIEISENNLYALRHFVHRTGLMHCPASSMCKKLLRLSQRRPAGADTILTLSRDVWMNSIGQILSGEVFDQLSLVEREAFTGCFTEIFSCFEGNKPGLKSNEVDLQEFAVGFCFFCSGNKSSKLATGFEVLDDQRKNYLDEDHLRRYLTSYLTMLVAMSVLVPISNHNSSGVIAHRHTNEMRSAVESGAKWTLGHFLKYSSDGRKGFHSGRYSFESFATWYSNGGYEVAPWLELLDLNKVLSLIGPSSLEAGVTSSGAPNTRDKMSSLRRHHSGRKGPPPEILFTFPLANHRSLVVLKDDAAYVRGVVELLGLLSMNPNELWAQLSKLVEKKKRASDSSQGTVYISMETFLSCMGEICPVLRRNKPGHPDRMRTSELLSNFFQCFDLEQRDSVAADELMGGLTLLCGGKKSHKLAFAFGVFDTRPGIQQKKKKEFIAHSLSGEDLFLFLRSILIVTFSCCRQSLDMTDGMVGRCIADTANMICNDVMRHQWDLRHKDRLNFDEFGQWYNDGGCERAPWLELLDLKKWVLVEHLDSVKKRPEAASSTTKPPTPPVSMPDPDVPPPPPEDELDPDFFESTIMPMDSVSVSDIFT